MAFSIYVTGVDNVQKVMVQAPGKLDGAATQAVKNSIAKVEGDAKRKSPLRTGRLRASIFSEMIGKMSGKVEVGAKYGVFVHEGTKPHIISVRTKRVLADKRTNRFFGKTVHHPGTKANPFLTDALQENEEYIKNQFKKEINNAIDKL